ncbi:MAG: ABC transporter permease [Chloroflexi bacterium]|nr:ABC transporter permease [Chloroflexota bacterium]
MNTQRFWFRFRKNRLAVVGIFVLLAIIALAVAAPILAPRDPARIDLDQREQSPSGAHWFGTDRLGRDVFARIVWGAQVSLGVSLLAVSLGSGIGILLGALAGYAGGALDALIARAIDLMLALPTFFLLVAIQALFPPNLINVIVIIGITSWMAIARIVRGQFLLLKQRDFVTAARASGVQPTRIIFRHILPNVSSQIIVFFTLGLADAVLVESALSFLGLGVPPYQASWGNMLNDGQIGILSGAWWVAFFPGLLILLTALSINLVGDGLQESLFK